ncbi:MAG TPA: rhodanese-like domain-containing protein [Acidimicrobiia bacterium]
MSGFERVPAPDWETWSQESGAVILDVRESEEWSLGTLPGSTLIAMTEITERVDELDKSTPILCVCRSGSRSAQVASYLSSVGFQHVANLEGGVKALGMQD